MAAAPSASVWRAAATCSAGPRRWATSPTSVAGTRIWRPGWPTWTCWPWSSTTTWRWNTPAAGRRGSSTACWATRDTCPTRRGPACCGRCWRGRSRGGVRHLVQLHLSRECNRPALAREAAQTVLDELAARVEVHTARQDEPGGSLHIGAGAAVRRTPRRGAGARPAPACGGASAIAGVGRFGSGRYGVRSNTRSPRSSDSAGTDGTSLSCVEYLDPRKAKKLHRVPRTTQGAAAVECQDQEVRYRAAGQERGRGSRITGLCAVSGWGGRWLGGRA